MLESLLIMLKALSLMSRTAKRREQNMPLQKQNKTEQNKKTKKLNAVLSK